jgi:ATP-binding protein involved in chromosome partitioning
MCNGMPFRSYKLNINFLKEKRMKQIVEKILIPGVKNLIVVASGKGGVGKSTISANLAITLANKGYKIALVDADIYGPSIPKMFDIENERPVLSDVESNKMEPIEKYGVKINSIGFFVDKDKSIIWRGPMVSNAITQLFTDTHWGDIDYMIIDFPPGTGDIQITTVQKFNINGALIVTTPQEIAVNDARKGAEMFLNSSIEVPLIGLVENMSWFTPKQHPEEKYYIFGKDGGQKLSSELGTPLLVQVPLIKEVGEVAEHGENYCNLQNEEMNSIFEKLAESVTQIVPVLS